MAIRLTNHIAYRLLNDETLIWEILELYHPEMLKIPKGADIPDTILSTYSMLNLKGNKTYYITNSVLDKLELLKVNRKDDRYDYTIFKELKPQKVTFILPDNKVIRMLITDIFDDKSQIVFDYIRFERSAESKFMGQMNSCMFYVNRLTGEQCSHFAHSDVKEIEDYLYRLLCFMYLSDIEEIVLQPGQKTGTKKTGKLINEIKHPITIVNSKWNITSIRTEGFAVSGHFRLQPWGEGRTKVRVQWIDPFEKKGYIRGAAKETHI
jgi:hypothetical protein